MSKTTSENESLGKFAYLPQRKAKGQSRLPARPLGESELSLARHPHAQLDLMRAQWPQLLELTKATDSTATCEVNVHQLHDKDLKHSFNLSKTTQMESGTRALSRLIRQYRMGKAGTLSHFISREIRSSSSPSVFVSQQSNLKEPTAAKAAYDAWRSAPTELLAKLHDSRISSGERAEAILFAEIAYFNGTQIDQLLPLLFDFIREHRFSPDDDTKTAVGAAIRKLALNLADSKIEDYAELLLPNETETLPCEVELEAVKAIVWRLARSPDVLAKRLPKLESVLVGLAKDYLSPRLILQRNYATTSVQAVLGILLVDGQQAIDLLTRIRALDIDWFSDLFRRKLDRLRSEVESRNNAPESVKRLLAFDIQFQSALV